MRAIIKHIIPLLLTAAVLTGCGTQPQSGSRVQSTERQAPALPEKQQELIVRRAVALMRESGHWQGYPLTSLGFDERRKQWKLQFSNGKPDGGYHVFIADEKSERIDILLFPPMWTKYERQRSSTNGSHGTQ